MDAKTQQLSNVQDLMQSMVFMMGTSFILGALTAILLMLLLDFMRRKKTTV